MVCNWKSREKKNISENRISLCYTNVPNQYECSQCRRLDYKFKSTGRETYMYMALLEFGISWFWNLPLLLLSSYVKRFKLFCHQKELYNGLLQPLVVLPHLLRICPKTRIGAVRFGKQSVRSAWAELVLNFVSDCNSLVCVFFLSGFHKQHHKLSNSMPGILAFRRSYT